MYDFIVVLRNGEKCLGETARVTGQYLIYWLEALGETRVYWGKPLVHLDLYQPAPGGPRAAVLVQAKIIRVTSSPLPRPTLLVLCFSPISHRAHPHPHPHPPAFYYTSLTKLTIRRPEQQILERDSSSSSSSAKLRDILLGYHATRIVVADDRPLPLTDYCTDVADLITVLYSHQAVILLKNPNACYSCDHIIAQTLLQLLLPDSASIFPA